MASAGYEEILKLLSIWNRGVVVDQDVSNAGMPGLGIDASFPSCGLYIIDQHLWRIPSTGWPFCAHGVSSV